MLCMRGSGYCTSAVPPELKNVLHATLLRLWCFEQLLQSSFPGEIFQAKDSMAQHVSSSSSRTEQPATVLRSAEQPDLKIASVHDVQRWLAAEKGASCSIVNAQQPKLKRYRAKGLKRKLSTASSHAKATKMKLPS